MKGLKGLRSEFEEGTGFKISFKMGGCQHWFKVTSIRVLPCLENFESVYSSSYAL